MNYELAKELKDAGFPLKPCKVGPDCEQWWYFPGKEAIHAPTLEELIEACGSDYFSMEECSPNRSGIWYAKSRYVDVRTEGDTPTEAVAKLWIALNKK